MLNVSLASQSRSLFMPIVWSFLYMARGVSTASPDFTKKKTGMHLPWKVLQHLLFFSITYRSLSTAASTKPPVRRQKPGWSKRDVWLRRQKHIAAQATLDRMALQDPLQAIQGHSLRSGDVKPFCYPNAIKPKPRPVPSKPYRDRFDTRPT